MTTARRNTAKGALSASWSAVTTLAEAVDSGAHALKAVADYARIEAEALASEAADEAAIQRVRHEREMAALKKEIGAIPVAA